MAHDLCLYPKSGSQINTKLLTLNPRPYRNLTIPAPVHAHTHTQTNANGWTSPTPLINFFNHASKSGNSPFQAQQQQLYSNLEAFVSSDPLTFKPHVCPEFTLGRRCCGGGRDVPCSRTGHGRPGPGLERACLDLKVLGLGFIRL